MYQKTKIFNSEKKSIMEIKSYNSDIEYNDAKARTQVILETAFSKEIRILLKKGQSMKEHKAPFPIVVHLLEGSIDFGIEGSSNRLEKGAILTLDANIVHNLNAHEDSIVRLTLSKLDKAERVEEATKN